MHDVESRELGGFDVEALISGPCSLAEVVASWLRAVSEYRYEDIEHLSPKGLKERDWKLVIHAAEMLLLDEGVVFSPKNGVRRKATKVSQVTGRESRMASAAMRKLERAVKVAAAAAPLAEDPEERRRIEARELKRANAVVSAKTALRGAGATRPKGI
jgi:hypothetical protein